MCPARRSTSRTPGAISRSTPVAMGTMASAATRASSSV
jgi:hypothetical protein